MPIYAYKCSACGFAKDVLQKISDPLLTECPSCHEAAFSKQLTAAGFQLKGSGWYATDFKGSGTSAPAVAPAAEAASASASPVESSPAKTESAPAAVASGGCSTGCACHS